LTKDPQQDIVCSLEGILSLKRARKNVVSQSSAEAKYRSMALATFELV